MDSVARVHGQTVSEALPYFSLDIAGVVAGYLVYGVPQAHSQPLWLNRGFGDFEQGYGCHAGVIIVPSDDTVWVVDESRIRVFDVEGTWQFDIAAAKVTGVAACSASGKVFTTHNDPVGIHVYRPDGQIARQLSVKGGKAAGQFRSIRAIAVNTRDQFLYVVDQGNYRVQVLRSDSGAFVRAFGRDGQGPGQFATPWSVAYDPVHGRVVVSDYSLARIQVFDCDGRFVRQFGSHGRLPGQLRGPRGVAVDRNGNIWVCDEKNSRVQVFQSDGTFVTMFGDSSLFQCPMDVCIGAEGHAYVCDYGESWMSGLYVIVAKKVVALAFALE